MNKTKLIITHIFLSIFIVSILLGCSKDEENNDGFLLHYPEVTNIGPSMSFISGAPSYIGGKPSNFAINKTKLDGKKIEQQSFTINETTGEISIANTDDLATGKYTLTISCKSDEKEYLFEDLFIIHMVSASPETLTLSSNLMEIPLAEMKNNDATIEITPEGDYVDIIGYELVQDENKQYLTINKKGVIGVNKRFKGDYIPGEYPISVKVITFAKEQIYESVAQLKITSKPLSLEYSMSDVNVEFNKAFESVLPDYVGSEDELNYTVKSIEPATDKIKVDSKNGKISLAADNGLEIGSSFDISLKLKNKYGEADFDNVYKVNIVAYIEPIVADTFKYSDCEAIQGTGFTIDLEEGFVGDEVKFALKNLPSELEGVLSIDEVSGQISAPKDNTIPLGDYTVTVVATNVKGSEETAVKIKVIENPYFFTYIRFGNNLDLPNDGTYASQYRCKTASDLESLVLKPETDIKDGVEVEWSVKAVYRCGNTSIDAKTGELTFATGGYKKNNGGLILVTAKVGGKSPSAMSMTVPVFFSFLNLPDGLELTYAPFVFQVNPRRGGTMPAPKISGIDNPSKLLMDYRRAFNYVNINGPVNHKNGQPREKGSFMNQLWTAYYQGIGSATVNTGARAPMSYYDNTANLAAALAYIKADTKELVVNPNKWVGDDNIPANGAFIGQVTYVTNGNEGAVAKGVQIFPIWIWLDEKF